MKMAFARTRHAARSTGTSKRNSLNIRLTRERQQVDVQHSASERNPDALAPAALTVNH
jgi:hypothetical protein